MKKTMMIFGIAIMLMMVSSVIAQDKYTEGFENSSINAYWDEYIYPTNVSVNYDGEAHFVTDDGTGFYSYYQSSAETINQEFSFKHITMPISPTNIGSSSLYFLGQLLHLLLGILILLHYLQMDML